MRSRLLLAVLLSAPLWGSRAEAQSLSATDAYEYFLSAVTASYDNQVVTQCPCPPSRDPRTTEKFVSCVNSLAKKMGRSASSYVKRTPYLKQGAVGSLTIKDALDLGVAARLRSCSATLVP
jgi:hypothetical protein